MNALEFIKAIAKHLKIDSCLIGVEDLVSGRAPRLDRTVTPGDTRLALIRTVCWARPPQETVDMHIFATRGMSAKSVAKLFVQLAYELDGKASAQGDRSRPPDPKDVKRLFEVYVRIMAGEGMRKDAPVSVATEQRVAMSSHQDLQGAWGSHMSDPEKVLLVAKRLESMPEDDRESGLRRLMKSASGLHSDEDGEFALLVRHAALHDVVN